nr:unnamed protein product [Callosobruchus chinensis]
MVLKMNLRHSNRRNMLKEIQLMNRLSHPNILRLMGVCVHEGQLHALTEYIDGGSLHQVIHDEREELPQPTRVRIARDVAMGMEYLHSKGIFHRDLTSKNVLVKRLSSASPYHRLQALVGDFGLSTTIPDPKAATQLPIVGSPYWMSPEGLNGRRYDQRSDVFSYGIVLCELIARVDADPDYLPRTDNFGLDYLAFTELCGPNVVPDFLTLAFRCCSIDPSSRPTFTDIVRALADVLADLDTAAHQQLRAKTAACAAARSEEQLAHVDGPIGTPHHRKIHHRRSLSEDIAMLQISCAATPSDKARRHALIACREDPHYKPRTTNPFAQLGRWHGVSKIVGNFSSCCEMPAVMMAEGTDRDVGELPKSLPGSPVSVRKSSSASTRCSIGVPTVTEMGSGLLRSCGSGSTLCELAAATSAPGGPLLRRRGSCESGFYSSVGECLSPGSLWGDSGGTAVSSLRSLDELEPAELHALCKRASSIYTDSSEDISSLTSTDWPPDLQPNISTIVDYFERKGATLRHPGGVRAGLQLSSRIAALRRSLERHNQGASSSGTLPGQRPKCTSRLVICEGAVRSKLPLFDKKP